MKASRKISQALMIVLFSISLASCTEDETMNELMETVEKYDITDSRLEDKEKDKSNPTGG
jgi:hypothetical protein